MSHATPTAGKGVNIAASIYEEIKGTMLEHNLKVIGNDGTPIMTGEYNGAIRKLEELLGRSLQWFICLLHCVELPLQQVFLNIDGSSTGPDSFSGPIGKKLSGKVSEWGVANFKPIKNANFPSIPNEVFDDLSTDQFCANRLCWCIMLGDVDKNMELLEVRPLYHARWLTMACRILGLYVSETKPSKNLATLPDFCMNVYFPSWFDIKFQNSISEGAKNYYAIMSRLMKFTNGETRNIALKTLERNSFYAHPENILLSMLSDEGYQVRCMAVNKILANRSEQRAATALIQSDNFKGGYQSDDDIDLENASTIQAYDHIRRFRRPNLNHKAKVYYKIMNMNLPDMEEPPATKHLCNKELEAIRQIPFRLKHPCHNQAVERHIQVVSESSAVVRLFERRDGLIRQKLKSRKLIKKN